MKAIIPAMAALLLLGNATFGANSITFTENLTDKLVTYRDPEFDETFTEVSRTISATISATVTYPGLSEIEFDEFSGVSVEFGGLSFSDEFFNAEQLTRNKAVFIEYEEDERGREVEVGRLTISRSGDTLTLTGNHQDLEFASIAAEGHAGDASEIGPISGQVDFRFSLGEIFVEQTIFYKGTKSVTHKTVGREFPEEYELYTVKITGEADTTKPSISISNPRNGFRSTDETILVRGKASDAYGLEEIFVSVNDEPVFEPVDYDEDTGTWSVEVLLAPGSNQVEAECFDGSGNSAVARIDITYVVMTPIILTHNAGGSVTGATDGQLLEVGKSYKLQAKADATHIFRAWYLNGDERTGATLEFVMEEGLEIEAEFAPNKFIAAKGSYSGLFHPAAAALDSPASIDIAALNSTNCGLVNLMLTDKGNVTGKLLFGGATVPFSGNCDAEGYMEITLNSRGLPPTRFEITFDLDENVGDARGSIATDEWESEMVLFRAANATEAASYAGAHTFMIPGADAENAATLPAGDGAGTFTLKSAGAIRLSGNLGDGAKITHAASVCYNGRWPFYVSLKRGQTLLMGWIDLIEDEEFGDGNALIWIKSPVSKDKIYSGGFRTVSGFFHAPYVAPARGGNVFGWTNGMVLIDGGNLDATITNRVQLAGNKVVMLDDNDQKITLKLALPTGTFSGSFTHPFTRKTVKVKGSLLQLDELEGSRGAGWFQGISETGYIELVPEILP